MMDLFTGQTLLRKNGTEIEEVSADEVLSGVPLIALYFSAHWCPPCRGFTPVLAEFFSQLKSDEKPFEVIFITSDESDDDMRNYMLESHGDWLAVQHDQTELRENLNGKFEIEGIPTLIVLKDGEMVTNSGRWDVQLKPDECYDNWLHGDAATKETDVDKFLEDVSKDDAEDDEDEK